MANRPSQNHRKHLRQEERRLEYLDDPGGESRAWTAVNLIQFNKQKRDLKIENESLIIKLNYFLWIFSHAVVRLFAVPFAFAYLFFLDLYISAA